MLCLVIDICHGRKQVEFEINMTEEIERRFDSVGNLSEVIRQKLQRELAEEMLKDGEKFEKIKKVYASSGRASSGNCFRSRRSSCLLMLSFIERVCPPIPVPGFQPGRGVGGHFVSEIMLYFSPAGDLYLERQKSSNCGTAPGMPARLSPGRLPDGCTW